MPNAKVTFLPHNIVISVPPGTTLIQAALDAGVHINASCGGEGVCGKCRVVVDAAILNRPAAQRRTARIRDFNLGELKEKGLFLAPVEKKCLELPPPSVQDNLPDLSRLIGQLQRAHGEHRLEADLTVIRKIPAVMRESGFTVTTTLVRPVRADGKTRIINVQPGDTSGRSYAIAMDIGTTTIYGQMIDLVSGAVLAEHAEFNGQISYGEDVITRIVYAEKPSGLDRIQGAVVATINKILGRIIQRSGVDPQDISTITLAGNTTMTQLLLKIEPRYIRRAPYVPASSLYPPIKACELGMNLEDHVTALVYPVVSSYVGGDIVAGVMGSGIHLSQEVTLFMDVGTNAEIVIGNKDWLACAACSAGPAFEGGGLQFGMRAAPGAIEDFSLNPATFEPMIATIGRQRPKGICGSGLINMVACMFELGVIDNRGKFDPGLKTPRLREKDGIHEFVLAWEKETQIDRDITISEIDIENLIRAKGAIYSGCMTLLTEVGMGIQDIERIILAGGFGSFVDLDKAMTIGLLPEIDPDKVTYLGNGSLLGARMSSLTNRIRRDVVEVIRKMTNFELSETASYMDNYIAALFLPHTDLDRFPRLQQRLAEKRLTRNPMP